MRIPGTFTFIEHILTFSFTFSNLDQFLVNVRVTIFVYLLITLLSGHSENIEHYKDNDYTEPIPDDGKRDLLEQQIRDKERDKRKCKFVRICL